MPKNVPDTSELHKILKTMNINEYSHFISENALPQENLSSYFESYMKEHQITCKDLIRDSLLDRTYVYQIISGKRKPKKDKILALCIAAKMSFEEIQRALEIAEEGILYPKNPRDAAIILFIHKKIYDIRKINSFLDQNGFEIIK